MKLMIDEKEFKKISHVMSHALRHEPWLYGLELDENGWTSVDDILSVLRVENSKWCGVTVLTLEGIIELSDKKRFEIYGGCIRALYGHSFLKKLKKQPVSPPAELYHGTSIEAATWILKDGLLPMKRQYVHLSIDKETAIMVGKRKSMHPVLLRVGSQDAVQHGVDFYQGNDIVWLADYIPKEYISVQ